MTQIQKKADKGFLKELDSVEPEAKEGPRFDYSRKVVPTQQDQSAYIKTPQFNKQRSSKAKSTIVKETLKHIQNRKDK